MLEGETEGAHFALLRHPHWRCGPWTFWASPAVKPVTPNYNRCMNSHITSNPKTPKASMFQLELGTIGKPEKVQNGNAQTKKANPWQRNFLGLGMSRILIPTFSLQFIVDPEGLILLIFLWFLGIKSFLGFFLPQILFQHAKSFAGTRCH